MNPSYFRIKIPFNKAVDRLSKWNGREYKEKTESTLSDVVNKAVDENQHWKGLCTFVYENDGWTVFEDLSGGYTEIPAEKWLELAENDSLVMAGYNDAILYGEMVVIEKGEILKAVFCDISMPEETVNDGVLYPEIEDWVDIAKFIDEDDIVFSEKGYLIIY